MISVLTCTCVVNCDVCMCGLMVLSCPFSYPVNGTVKFSSSESMDDNVKKVTGSVTKTDGVARHKISGKGFSAYNFTHLWETL